MFGYVLEKATNKIIMYWNLNNKPEDTEYLQYIECLESEKPEIIYDIYYIPESLISWALQQVFAADLIPHMAAFLDFANKASQPATDNFRAYATAVSQAALAETIIAKAIELGAKIV